MDEQATEREPIVAFPEALLALRFAEGIRGRAGTQVVLGADAEFLRRFYRHVRFYEPGRRIRYVRDLPDGPSWPEALRSAARRLTVDQLRESMAGILALAGREAAAVFVCAEILARPVQPLAQFKSGIIDLAVGDEVDLDDLIQTLVSAGYERTSTVRDPGTFAVRGSLVDVFPPQEQSPVRLDFEDVKLVGIRSFDPGSQATQADVSRAVFPAMPGGQARGEERIGAAPSAVWGEWLSGCAMYHLEETPGEELPGTALSPFPAEGEGERLEAPALPLGIGAQVETFNRLLAEGWSVVLGLPSDLGRRVAEYFTEKRLPFQQMAAGTFPGRFKPGVFLIEGDLPGGFRDDARRLILLSAADLFPRRKGVDLDSPSGLRYDAPVRGYAARTITDVLELAEGDFVVHEQYGIGIFRGLKRIKTREEEGEYLAIEYRDKDILYVPFDKFHMVQKYIGTGRKPKPHRLGEAAWQKIKRGAREKIEAFARDLLGLYATREHQSGYAFPADTVFQQEFEMQFPYEETGDQVKAIEEVKRDMERPKPMDRLVCGDAGFGKTEVALRAAFKAAADGKQVAVVVPTTLLAEQHRQVFEERFREFSVSIAELSRFRTPAEQAEILRRLKSGELDICIGTHRLLQDDVAFADLGLLIIDEEHRFGVRQKERLKFYRQHVDVISMTATPIPRTLYMSLIGTRDISLIETPPRSRIPIHTEIYPYHADLVREAARAEMGRGGQVFFLYNRVETIDRSADWVRRAVPESRVGIAHGQMSEEELSGVMTAFTERKLDILVTTTIIESGLDLPNANTIFIADAERFGLSTLYQLRGRVGRSDRPAYCYLLMPQDPKPVSGTARRRLEAIAAIAGVGGGYRVALEDLTLRGAGNLLGSEQHGVVWEIGFEMYCEMLKNSIVELRGERPEPPWNVSVDLKIPQFIPEEFAPEVGERMSLYRRVARCRTLAQLKEMEDSLQDRFGTFPQSLKNLMLVRRLKLLAKTHLITEVIEWNKSLSVYSDESRTVRTLTRKLSPTQVTPRQIEYGLRGVTAEVFLEKFVECLIRSKY
ncbi:transcription-repair coupling factor [bacterium]|nr:transcription-repair coupling factor [bacterium]